MKYHASQGKIDTRTQAITLQALNLSYQKTKFDVNRSIDYLPFLSLYLAAATSSLKTDKYYTFQHMHNRKFFWRLCCAVCSCCLFTQELSERLF